MDSNPYPRSLMNEDDTMVTLSVTFSSMGAFKNAGHHAPILNHMSIGLALIGDHS